MRLVQDGGDVFRPQDMSYVTGMLIAVVVVI